LVSGVAHDFNNLLTGIMLYCDLMLLELEKTRSAHRPPGENPMNEDRNKEEYGQLLHCTKEIRAAGVRGTALIQQLMAVARQERGDRIVFSLNETILGLRDLLSRLIGENIELVTDLATDLKPLEMEPIRAQQIVLNLVLNARDAMPEGGKIVLCTRNRMLAGAAMTEFSVSDTGCGMGGLNAAEILQPFFTTKKRSEGHGLGLATVHSIVQEVRGAIHFESTQGKGTRVEVCLPVARPVNAVELPNALVSSEGSAPVLAFSGGKSRAKANARRRQSL